MFKKMLVLCAWMFSSLLTLGVSTTTMYFLTKPQEVEPQISLNNQNNAGSVLGYNSTPKQTGFTTSIIKEDARPAIIQQYLERYNSPMAPYSQLIVDTAETVAAEFNLNATHLAFLTAAIAQNESNLGKKAPDDCYNAWGWGIHKRGTLCFESWEEGIKTYMHDFAEQYMYKRGLTNPEEIMRIYTPHSPGGAWAKNVSQFLEQLETANF